MSRMSPGGAGWISVVPGARAAWRMAQRQIEDTLGAATVMQLPAHADEVMTRLAPLLAEA